MSDEAVAMAIDGEVINEGLIRVVTSWPNDHLHGHVPVSSLVDTDLRTLTGQDVSFDRLLAIDTETTGLSGGSGTVAFNIGCAQLVNGSVLVTQYLLTRYSGERAMLDELSQMLINTQTLVTYNGKSFDLPLLVTRFRMQRRDPLFLNINHLDLLHPVRSLFSKSWPDCRLGTAETRALGFSRENDLPGYLVPAAWADFLRDRQPHGLKQVLEHNKYDVFSLLALTAQLARVVSSSAPTVASIHTPWVDTLALARFLRKLGQREQSLALLEKSQSQLSLMGQLELAREWRRTGRLSDALVIWETLASKGVLEALESCAKFHEHSSKNLTAALGYTEELIAKGGRRPPHLHRFERLSRKLAS